MICFISQHEIDLVKCLYQTLPQVSFAVWLVLSDFLCHVFLTKFDYFTAKRTLTIINLSLQRCPKSCRLQKSQFALGYWRHMLLVHGVSFSVASKSTMTYWSCLSDNAWLEYQQSSSIFLMWEPRTWYGPTQWMTLRCAACHSKL